MAARNARIEIGQGKARRLIIADPGVVSLPLDRWSAKSTRRIEAMPSPPDYAHALFTVKPALVWDHRPGSH